VGVLDPHPTLLGAVHEEESAEAPDRLAAQALLALSVQQQDRPSGIGHLGGSDQLRQTGTHHDHVCCTRTGHEQRL
jgi:hypothetical protein